MTARSIRLTLDIDLIRRVDALTLARVQAIRQGQAPPPEPTRHTTITELLELALTTNERPTMTTMNTAELLRRSHALTADVAALDRKPLALRDLEHAEAADQLEEELDAIRQRLGELAQRAARLAEDPYTRGRARITDATLDALADGKLDRVLRHDPDVIGATITELALDALDSGGVDLIDHDNRLTLQLAAAEGTAAMGALENLTSHPSIPAAALELDRQRHKWGEQNHPSSHADGVYTVPSDIDGAHAEEFLRRQCEERAADGSITWLDILLEEVAEAANAARRADMARTEAPTLAKTALAELSAEVIQVAAVALAWADSIGRNAR